MGMHAKLPKGAEVTMNGLAVVLEENLHFTILAAETMDQAAELAHAHRIPCDTAYFSHFDEAGGVNVTYSSLDATRIETVPETAAVEAPAPEETASEPETPKKKKDK